MTNIDGPDWLKGPIYEDFRKALSYARSHFMQAAPAFAKVDAGDAFWIHSTIERGFQTQVRMSDADKDGVIMVPLELMTAVAEALESRGLAARKLPSAECLWRICEA